MLNKSEDSLADKITKLEEKVERYGNVIGCIQCNLDPLMGYPADPESVPLETIIERAAKEITRNRTRIDHLVEQADATYAPYRQMVQEARAEVEKFSTRVLELEKENTRLKDESRWIPVGERLPDMRQLVRVCGKGWVSEAKLVEPFMSYPATWVQIDGMQLRGVTHWKLPELPEIPHAK